MARRILLFVVFGCLARSAGAQYKNDNVLYRLVYLQDLCKTMNENPGALILDVRSHGEYDDTSAYSNLNVGRFKNAVNIPVQELDHRISEIRNYKDQPVFVYCSHSQRSRRASKMLADSGFTKVFNVNEGFTGTHLSSGSSLACVLAKSEMNTGYSILSPQDLSALITKDNKSIYLLDVRPDSVYNGTTSEEMLKAYGTIKGSHHIARNDIEAKKETIPADKPIVVIDSYGDESAKVASWLITNGYKNVSILFNGIDAWLSIADNELPGKNDLLVTNQSYKLLASGDFKKFATANPGTLLIDVRSKEEFSNQSKEHWRNIGNLKGAVNIPALEFDIKRPEISGYQDKPVLVYSFSGDGAAYYVARELADAGYKNVHILMGGLFHLRWMAHNVKGREHSDDMVVNVPAENL